MPARPRWTTEDTGLLIGMNAKLNIILSTTDNVFAVPFDAVGTDENGGSVVYVKTGGSGGETAFTPVPVTTGAWRTTIISRSPATGCTTGWRCAAAPTPMYGHGRRRARTTGGGAAKSPV
ncbi:MAG: hypothetical protein V8T36_02630 [Ruthenibacterium lactatiformans]